MANEVKHVASIATLGSIDNTYSEVVIVEDEMRTSGNPFVWKTTGTANGGTVYAGSSGGFWHMMYDGPINVEWFEVKGDYMDLIDLSIDIVTDDTLVTASAPVFTPEDVDKTIIIWGAGTGTDGGLGDELITTIDSWVSSTEVRLADPATVSVIDHKGGMGTDNSVKLQGVLDEYNENSVIEFRPQRKYYFGTNFTYAGYYDFCFKIDGGSNVQLNGNGCSIYFISSNPKSYEATPRQASKNLLQINESEHVCIEQFHFFNIGQTIARRDDFGDPNEYKYWGSETGYTLDYYDANSLPTPAYNRRYNKTANSGSAIYNWDSKYISLKNCCSFEVGNFYDIGTTGTKEDVIGGIIENNLIEGYAVTAISPGEEYKVVKNSINNGQAPIVTPAEANSGLGASHAIYVHSAFSGCIITENTITDCRRYGVQFHTGSSDSSKENIVSLNQFIRCTDVGVVSGSDTDKTIMFTDNYIVESGAFAVQHSGAAFYASNNIWVGAFAYPILPSALIPDCYTLFQAKLVMINGDRFSGRAYAWETGKCITIGNDASLKDIVIENCYVEKDNNVFIDINTSLTSFTGSILVKNCTIRATSRIFRSSSFSSPITFTLTFQENTFLVEENDYNTFPLLYLTGGANVINNTFILTSGSYGLFYGDLGTGAADLNLCDNKFINSGSSSAIRFNSSIQKVSMIGNYFYSSSISVTGVASTYKTKKGNYYSVTESYDLTSTSKVVSSSHAMETPFTDYIFSGATATWTLPNLADNIDLVYRIKNRGSGTLTINSASSNEIYTTAAASSIAVAAGDSVTLVNDGTYWNVE